MIRTSLKPLVLALVLALPLAAQEARAQDAVRAERLLTVTGEGSVHAAPDTAMITLGVVTEQANASAALAGNNASMSRIVDTLKQAGLAPRDLQTSGFSVEPVYSQQPPDFKGPEPFRPQIVGYRVHNSLSVRIRDLSRVGAVLDRVVTLGANSISGPVFTVEDSTTIEDEARRAAIADALRKGKLYGEAAQVALGPIFAIQEGYSRAPQPMAQGAMYRMAADAGSVPVESGELTFEAQVTVSWILAE